jgi:hypothetical protein
MLYAFGIPGRPTASPDSGRRAVRPMVARLAIAVSVGEGWRVRPGGLLTVGGRDQSASVVGRAEVSRRRMVDADV